MREPATGGAVAPEGSDAVVVDTVEELLADAVPGVRAEVLAASAPVTVPTDVAGVPGAATTASLATVAARPTRPAKGPFRRWATATLVANAVVVAVLLIVPPASPAAAESVLVTLAGITIGVGSVIRSSPVVNRIFRLALRAPHRWPLRVRASIAQVHQMLAGIHVGACVAAVGWFGAFTVATVVALVVGPVSGHGIAILAVAATEFSVLATMSLLARPRRREKRHDLFEQTHRWGSWVTILLFAVLTVLLASAAPRPFRAALAAAPGTWILVVVLAVAAQPWVRLRRVPVAVHAPSKHVALVTLDRRRQFDAGSVTRIARTPLKGWHAFANIAAPGTTTYRLAVSRAGGWTGRFIEQRPDRIWVRGTATLGMSSVSRLFTRVVWLATGSGIAPCLPHLLHDRTDATLVWVTRDPERTYGPELVGEVLRAQPDARLWNTDDHGKPDLAALAEHAYHQTGAEAVVCISNRATTLAVVGELRSRGIHAYGPIWDS